MRGEEEKRENVEKVEKVEEKKVEKGSRREMRHWHSLIPYSGVYIISESHLIKWIPYIPPFTTLPFIGNDKIHNNHPCYHSGFRVFSFSFEKLDLFILY